ncbi:hypothetical protein AVEN_162950-1 [Araneus ventricosus]|uniref:Uncharacterized protein n=1 Tax=Araneus ventricosus TaxID=182803 RepID=A0A4Y2BZJ2_ARAVE|nr:hypothetical protein AVEN_162950-1 [Araneus ventricosus]
MLLSFDEAVKYLNLSDEEHVDHIDSDRKSSCNLSESVSDSSTKDESHNVEEVAEGDEANLESLQCASGLNIDVDRIESISESSESETDVEAIREWLQHHMNGVKTCKRYLIKVE